jgi:hypothetical protein
MGHDLPGIPDAVELAQTVAKNRAFGGFVTPGAGVNVNVAPLIAEVAGTDAESAGATNLTVTAGAGVGQTVSNAIVMNAAGVISALAGTSATTGTQVAPAIDETLYVLLAHVDVANGAVAVVQANISNKARRWL